jgi:hypothetical protein
MPFLSSCSSQITTDVAFVCAGIRDLGRFPLEPYQEPAVARPLWRSTGTRRLPCPLKVGEMNYFPDIQTQRLRKSVKIVHIAAASQPGGRVSQLTSHSPLRPAAAGPPDIRDHPPISDQFMTVQGSRQGSYIH